MRELNGEQIKRALEEVEDTYIYLYKGTDGVWHEVRYSHILALINSQEQKIKELTEENERLRWISASICIGDVITPEQMEELRMAHTLPGMHGDPVGEIGECGMKHKCVAETVQKMQEKLKNYLREVADGDIGYSWIDQIAKEMLEGKDELH